MVPRPFFYFLVFWQLLTSFISALFRVIFSALCTYLVFCFEHQYNSINRQLVKNHGPASQSDIAYFFHFLARYQPLRVHQFLLAILSIVLVATQTGIVLVLRRIDLGLATLGRRRHASVFLVVHIETLRADVQIRENKRKNK